MSDSVWQAPLDRFQTGVAAPHPTPAGVTTSCVTAALALSLLMKALRITGKRPDLLPRAEELIAELRSCADEDVAGVQAYIERRETQALREVPGRAAHAITQAILLCPPAAEAVKGLISADIEAATALLQGAEIAVQACIAANAR